MMTETVRITTATGVVEMTRIEAMLRAMFGLAVEGNQRAQSLLVNLYKVAVPEEQEPPDHGMANFHEFPFEFLNVGFLD